MNKVSQYGKDRVSLQRSGTLFKILIEGKRRLMDLWCGQKPQVIIYPVLHPFALYKINAECQMGV